MRQIVDLFTARRAGKLVVNIDREFAPEDASAVHAKRTLLLRT